jgi:hypothetical protein
LAENKKNKKSQAAMEFITTYGWALIIVITVISALTYYGIYSPKKVIPDRCSFSTEFFCRDFSLSGNLAQLAVINNLGGKITVTNVESYPPNGNIIVCLTFDKDNNEKTVFDASEMFYIKCDGTLTLPVGEKVKMKIIMTYVKDIYPHTIEGEVVGTVN